MREYLFRGKRTDNGEWVEGYLFCIWERAYILWGTINGVPNMIEVDLDTVGQYAGLTDKNGKKIFDGDIFPSPSKPKYKYVAYWDDEEGGFPMFCHEGSGFSAQKIEIIGNIHDNPELLRRSK